MDQFDREDSSKYSDRQNQPAPVEQQPVQPVAPAPKQKKSKAALILSLLLFLALLAAASIGWLWYQQSGRVDNLEADLSVARNNLASLESAAKAESNLDDQPTAIAEEEVKTDQEMLLETAQAYTDGLIASERDSSTKFDIAKFQLPFARVNISTKGAGSMCIYKLVDETWLRLYCGQADTEESLNYDRIYAVPASIKSS